MFLWNDEGAVDKKTISTGLSYALLVGTGGNDLQHICATVIHCWELKKYLNLQIKPQYDKKL